MTRPDVDDCWRWSSPEAVVGVDIPSCDAAAEGVVSEVIDSI
jgi:hypothetical protein